MGLAQYITACSIPDGCYACKFKAELQAEDEAVAAREVKFLHDHKAFLRQLKAWAKTQSPEARAKLFAQINKG